MTTRGVLVSPEYPGRGGSGDSKRRRPAAPCAPVAPFCPPAVSWLQPLPLAGGGGSGEPSRSRPASGDGHTPVPPESSSPQTTEEPLSPVNDGE